MKKLIKDLFYQTEGKYTEELALKESSLGLGKFPERLLPDGISKMVCGYCSTGCALDVHIKKGCAVNVTPAHDYPVNLGEACPKGWEALTPLKARRTLNSLRRLASESNCNWLTFISTRETWRRQRNMSMPPVA